MNTKKGKHGNLFKFAVGVLTPPHVRTVVLTFLRSSNRNRISWLLSLSPQNASCYQDIKIHAKKNPYDVTKFSTKAVKIRKLPN